MEIRPVWAAPINEYRRTDEHDESNKRLREYAKTPTNGSAFEIVSELGSIRTQR